MLQHLERAYGIVVSRISLAMGFNRFLQDHQPFCAGGRGGFRAEFEADIALHSCGSPERASAAPDLQQDVVVIQVTSGEIKLRLLFLVVLLGPLQLIIETFRAGDSRPEESQVAVLTAEVFKSHESAEFRRWFDSASCEQRNDIAGSYALQNAQMRTCTQRACRGLGHRLRPDRARPKKQRSPA